MKYFRGDRASHGGDNGRSPSRTGRNGWGPVTGSFSRGSVTKEPQRQYIVIRFQIKG
jgi:hypothetical protein